jgi:membrane-associated phospholipid phosphatase
MACDRVVARRSRRTYHEPVERLRRELHRGVAGSGWRGLALALVLAVLVYATSKLYGSLNHAPYRFFLRTPLDQAMPTVTPFVVPYVSLEPVTYGTLVFFLLFRIRLYRSASVSLIAAFLVAAVFFAFAQTYVQRPSITGNDIFARMVRDVYAGDNPYNDFPSLHVGVSTILAIHWWRAGRTAGWIAAAWAVVVIASTQLIHQHYLVDIAGGLLLAFAVTRVGLRYFVDRPGRGGDQDRVVEAAARAGVAGGAAGGHA